MKRRWRFVGIAGLLVVLVLIGGSLWIIGRAFQRQQATHNLVVAVYKNQTASALAALRAGADPNTCQIPTDKPLTLMQFCIQFWQRIRGRKGQEQVASVPSPPMMTLAAAKDNTAIVLALLAHGAKPDAFTHYSGAWREDDNDPTGCTALMLAAEHDNVSMTKALLAKGANPNFNDSLSCEAPLLLTHDPAVMKILLAHGANVHTQMRRQSNPASPLINILTSSVASDRLNRRNRYQCLEVLLAYGADLNECTKAGDGETPLTVAALYNTPADLRFLLARGADPNLPGILSKTPLEIAIEIGQTDKIKTLLVHGANPNKCDTKGRTPLFCAVEHGETAPVQALICGGAKVNVKDNEGKTPLQLAEENENGGNDSVEGILRAAGARDY